RLAQLRRQRQVLPKFDLQGLFHGQDANGLPLAPALKAERVAEVDAADIRIREYGIGGALGEDASFIEDIRPVADAQGLAHVMVGNEHADAALAQVTDDLLDLAHGNRIDASER